jgi:hypothetical protein
MSGPIPLLTFNLAERGSERPSLVTLGAFASVRCSAKAAYTFCERHLGRSCLRYILPRHTAMAEPTMRRDIHDVDAVSQRERVQSVVSGSDLTETYPVPSPRQRRAAASQLVKRRVFTPKGNSFS